MGENVLTGAEALALIVFYFGSVGIPVLVYVIMQLSKLADLHEECRSMVSYLKHVKPAGGLLEYCKYVSYDCNDVVHEKNRQARIAIVAVIFGGLYLALGVMAEPVDWQAAFLYLLLSLLFPIAILWIVHTSIDSYTGFIGDVKGFLQANYRNGNTESRGINEEHGGPETQNRG